MSFLLTPARRVASLSSTRAFSTSRPSQLARMTLIGRLGSDPQIKSNEAGQTRIEYSLATTAKVKGQDKTSWYRITSFAQEGTGPRTYIEGLTKGTLVYLEADARMDEYEDKNGIQRQNLSLLQSKIQVLQRYKSNEGEE